MTSPSCHVPRFTRRNTVAAGDEVKIAERTKLIPGNDKGQMPPSFELTSKIIVTRQRQAPGFVAARLGSDMVVGTYVGKEVGV